MCLAEGLREGEWIRDERNSRREEKTSQNYVFNQQRCSFGWQIGRRAREGGRSATVFSYATRRAREAKFQSEKRLALLLDVAQASELEWMA